MDRFFFKFEISKLALPGVMIMFDLANETRKKGMDREMVPVSTRWRRGKFRCPNTLSPFK